MFIGFLNMIRTDRVWMLAIGVAVTLLILLITIFAIRSAGKNKIKSAAIDASDDDDMTEYFETPEIVEDVMTTHEKQAYHYFVDDDTDKKGGCLRKGGNNALSDEDFDKISTYKLNDFGNRAHALEKLGLDESQVNEIEPIRFHGYEKYARRLNNNFMEKLGKDGRLRSSVCSVTWLFFGNDQIYVYSGKFDLITSAKRETTTEYFYKDITNFNTFAETEQNLELKSSTSGCLKKKSSVTIERNLTEHDSFSLAVSGDKFSCSVSGVANAKQIIDGVKQKLREKKFI